MRRERRPPSSLLRFLLLAVVLGRGAWAVFLACRPHEVMPHDTGPRAFLHAVTREDGWAVLHDQICRA